MKVLLVMLFASLIFNGCTPSIYKCTSDFDCKSGYLCRMEADVGSECGIKTVADIKKPNIEPVKEISYPPSIMVCQTDSDCGAGHSCRSKVSGGTECKVKSVSNVTSPDTAMLNCQNDFDCLAGYSCRTKPESGSECRIKTTNKVVKASPFIDLIPKVKEQTESPITNLEEIKAKCKELGFKPQSDKFGKCVLELTK